MFKGWLDGFLLGITVSFVLFLLIMYFKIVQECLVELFEARLGVHPSAGKANLYMLFQDQEAPSEDPAYHVASLLSRIHKPSRGLLSENVRKDYTLYDPLL